KCLQQYVNTIENKQLRQAIDYALFPGGKRLRPLLLLLTLADFGINQEMGIYIAVALEMIHTYSLIHDDLPAMDDDDFRRGKASLHKQFSEAVAILAGDALLSDAFGFITKSPLEATTITKIVALISQKTGSNGMVQGQMMDISDNHLLNEQFITLMNSRKTGDLFMVALQGAGLIAKVDEKFYLQLGEIALSLGLAFQIKDDLDDYSHEQAFEPNTFVALFGQAKARDLFIYYRELTFERIKSYLGENNLYDFAKRIL
ncbi:MAG TPA: polyprenyl synthetase family protein, partial [Bacilli bacterium]|nr:polyprenyl synthetase family protein [Bacilli bacterium]